MVDEVRVCADCLFIGESVRFDEDSNLFLCPDCFIELELADWADEMMEEYGWLEGFDGSYTGTSGYTGSSGDNLDSTPEAN